MNWFHKTLAVAIVCLGSSYAFGAGLSLFTAPGGTNPINNPSVLADMNKLIVNINAALGSFLTFNNSTAENGELAFTSGSSFVANGTVSVAAIGSTGVYGTKGIVHEWLTIVDEGGAIGYVPVYE
jgi:hypothetical protein